MYFIAAFLIISISIIFSSLLYLFGVVQWSNISYNYYILFNIIITFIAFKLIFKRIVYFKINLLRLIVKINNTYSKLNVLDIKSNSVLNEMQLKSIRLWKMCVNDKRATLLSSIKSFERQIETDILLITLTPFSPSESVMTIFDISDGKRCLYEVHIPDKHLEEICSYFDVEVQNRIKNINISKRKLIQDDLDNLLVLQSQKYIA